MLARLVVRPDRAMAIAALGMAAGILLPVLGSLALANLAVPPSGPWVAYAPAGGQLDVSKASQAPSWVIAQSQADPNLVAYRVGDPIVEPGDRLAMPEATVPSTHLASTLLPGLRPDQVLIHPSDLGRSRDVVAGFTGAASLPGAITAQQRGADAFEVATTGALRTQAGFLIALSVPAVALVASAFARQEVRARERQSATLSALGGTRMATLLLLWRTGLTACLGGGIALVAGYAIYRFGGSLFHPADAPRHTIELAIALPTLAGIAVGAFWSWRDRASMESLRSAGPAGENDVGMGVPAQARPLLLGLRPLAILLLAATLFVADVGFPLAAAKVPAALSGGLDEWIFGADEGLQVGRGIGVGSAEILHLDERVEAALAETVAPTLLDGSPVVVRGGTWARLATFYGLHLVAGEAPGLYGIAIGDRLAERQGLDVGDTVVLQGGNGPTAFTLTVSGIARGPTLLRDEAFLAEPTGRWVAGVGAGQASLVHVRPDTKDALAALEQVAPNLVAPEIAIEPRAPVPGSIATAAVTVVNLGTQAGQRTLTLRLNGDAVATQTATVPGHGTVVVRIPFLAPDGHMRVEVNPEASGASSTATRTWDGPPTAQAGLPFQAVLKDPDGPLAGVPVGLYRDLDSAAGDRPTALGTTGTGGEVTFTAPDAGSWTLGTRDADRVFTGIEVVGGAGQVTVESVWTEPASLVLEATNLLKAEVHNPGSEVAGARVPAFVGNLEFASYEVLLQPGESRVLSYNLYVIEMPTTVGVGGLNLTLGSQVASSAPPPAPPATVGDGLPRRGADVQAQVADRALGDARAILLGLAGSAVVSSLALVALTTKRTLAGRRHVVQLLHVLGWTPERIAERAAAEGAVLGAAAALAAIVPAKLLFAAMAAWGPRVFAHSLPDPIGWLFSIQTVAAFAGVCALAAYFATSTETKSL
ncbi:MAG: hypothetical protein ACYC2H_06375 [Thermoplasmatota archaeon]